MTLYPYQNDALNQVRDKNRCAIYYDMGLGKTFIGSEKMVQLGSKINLIICQKSKINDWLIHFKENYTNLLILNLTNVVELEMFLVEDNMRCGSYTQAIGIINYDLVWRRPDLLKLHNFTLMLDESSLITNRTAKRSAFILRLDPVNVILLSGTPTAGKYEKLWSQLKLLGWNIDEETFFKSYVDYEWVENSDGYFEKKIKGYKNVEHLKKRLAQFGAIFKKTEEVIELPEQIEQLLYVEASAEYKKFKDKHYVQVGDRELIGDTMMAKKLYSRELCGQYSQAKLEAFRDLVESTEDRLVVFYNFTEELMRMLALVQDRPVSIVNGSTKDLSAYDTANDSITFVQFQAGAYGLNLQKANKIIYFTLPWGLGSCDLWVQSKKRIHRLGQKKPCFYYYLLVKHSEEPWNLELLKTGRDLTDDLFKNSEWGG